MREAVGRDTTHQIKQPRLKRSPSHTSTIGLKAEMHHDWCVVIEALCIELGFMQPSSISFDKYVPLRMVGEVR